VYEGQVEFEDAEGWLTGVVGALLRNPSFWLFSLGASASSV
jgi:hypothetical protein